jgi:hypothetical protein
MYWLCTYIVDALKQKNLGFPSAMLVRDMLNASCKAIEKTRGDVLVNKESNN